MAIRRDERSARGLALGLMLAAAWGGAACGGAAAPTPTVQGRAEGGAPAPAVDEAVATLRALAAAVRADDGVALAALVHPVHGLWLWHQPGAVVAPLLRLDAGDASPPSRRLDHPDVIPYWREAYWRHVADNLDGGLAALDREPADRRDPVYGDCAALDDGGDAPPTRAWLVADDDLGYRAELAVDHRVALDPAVVRGLVHYRRWGLDVWLARAGGRLWLVHVMVWTPCDA